VSVLLVHLADLLVCLLLLSIGFLLGLLLHILLVVEDPNFVDVLEGKE